MRLCCASIRRLSLSKLLLIINIFTLVFVEFLVYWLQTWRWPAVPRNGSTSETVVLFVADPQIVGYNDEPRVLGYITRWDNYRYLGITFNLAYEYVRPDVVVFLGDLIDEGSRCTDEQYLSYVESFKEIYKKAQRVQTLYIYGDNDVGGEGDARTPAKLTRFSQHFSHLPTVTHLKFVNMVSLDEQFTWWGGAQARLAQQHSLQTLANSLLKPYTVVLNHETVLHHSLARIKPILDTLKPNIFFSAHLHTSHLVTCFNESGKSHEVMAELGVIPGALRLNITQPGFLYEVIVPTCSYRMGVPDMGFGMAVFKSEGIVDYNILWLPARYTMLAFYLVLPLSLLILLAVCCGKRITDNKQQQVYARVQWRDSRYGP